MIEETVTALMDTAVLLTQHGWCQSWSGPNGERCLLHALYDATTANPVVYLSAREALDKFTTGEDFMGDIGAWNDQPGRLLIDVEVAIALAINDVRKASVPAS